MTIAHRFSTWLGLIVVLGITAAVYWPAMSGGYIFDDYPNIVDNASVQPEHATVPLLARAALSSPASEFKRPIASLSFAANFLVDGMNPVGFKVTNLVIHLANGVLLFILAGLLLRRTYAQATRTWVRITALAIALGWMILPINITAVVYVVQRMESLANLFVLAGLIGYVVGRIRSLDGRRGTLLAIGSVILATGLGSLAKETAVMLPLYALIVEVGLIRPLRPECDLADDRRMAIFYTLVLVLPAVIGLAVIGPKMLSAASWAHRDFTPGTRLLSEARIVVGYIVWTFAPTPHALSFYHDDYVPSISIFRPASTWLSCVALSALVGIMVYCHRRRPLIFLGIGWFLASNLLTGTIIPLELIYEHRNYFASIGLLLCVVPLLVPTALKGDDKPPMAVVRVVALVCLLVYWLMQTAMTTTAWGDPLRLAQDLAWRAPDSPRAQYELGRTYIIYSHYNPASPFTPLAYAPLERAAAIPGSTILAEQALIFFNAHLHLPIKDAWWTSMTTKLIARPAGVQDESSLDALSRCATDGNCSLDAKKLKAAFEAAMQQSSPSARLMAIYGAYAWNGLEDRKLGLNLLERATAVAPNEPAYHLTLGRMYASDRMREKALAQVMRLQALDHAGSLDGDIRDLETSIDHLGQDIDD